MQVMHKRISYTLVALALTLVGTSCSDDEPTESSKDAVNGGPPAAGPSSSTPSPDPTAPLPTPDVPPNFCAAVEAWCPTPYLWPQSEFTPELGPQQCYCKCDANLGSPGPSCSLSPQTSDCGTIFDVVNNPDGTITKKQRFPGGWPMVCRYSEVVQAQ